MGLQDTQHYVVTAATSSILDKYEAIRNHFNSAPGRWELGYLSGGGDGIVVVRKAPSAVTTSVAIRRNVASDSLFVAASDTAFFNNGNTSTPAGLLGDGVAERAYVPGTAHNKMLIIEHDDAITILDYAAAENAVPVGAHAGVVYVPSDPAFEDAGCNGIGVLVGPPTLQGIGSFAAGWVGGSTSTASRIRGFTDERNIYAFQVDGGTTAEDQTVGAVAAPVFCGLHQANTSGTAPMPLGALKWLRFVSANATGAGVPLTRYESADVGWCRISPTNTINARLCINCEHGKAVK